ncbi:MAG: hypothetical protein AAB491_01230 [Patescibacteria group bacterium]
MDKVKFLNIVGLSFSLLGAIFLFFGSQEVPWDIQTWGGISPNELMFKVIRDFRAECGFGLLGLGFLLQIIAQFYESNKKSKK